MKRLTLVPEGGLANRMKAIASAYALCRENCHLQIIWFKDKGLNAGFHDIFRPIPSENFAHLREARPKDYILNDRPRLKNLMIPRLMQRLFYNKQLYAYQMMDLIKNGYNFKSLLTNGGGGGK